jgi:hypothetical protein
VGDWVETGEGEEAVLDVADIGHLRVRPRTRLGLIATGEDEHRLHLARGSLHATVFAPPRLFVVETPAARAVDLGCVYSLDVEEDGHGRLVVESGRVALERGDLSVTVPREAHCTILPRSGPGVPHFGDAPADLRAALARLAEAPRDAAALARALATARPRDTLSLWHLLARTEGEARERVYERMAALVAPPARVERAAALALDPVALEAWWDELSWEVWYAKGETRKSG